jgi:hypothetical protein
MKTVVSCFLFIMLIIVFSCEKGFFINCSECLTEEPVNTQLKIKLSSYLGIYAYSVIVNIYEGNIENNVLVQSWQSYNNGFVLPSMYLSHKVQLNKKYTVTATYFYYDGKTYMTIDSATPGVQYDKSLCKAPCYYIYDKILNLMLKYD